METSELELTELVLVCVNQWPYTALDMTHMQCLMVCNCVFIKLYVKVCNCALSKILNSKTVFSSVPGDLLPTPGYCNLGDLKKDQDGNFKGRKDTSLFVDLDISF